MVNQTNVLITILLNSWLLNHILKWLNLASVITISLETLILCKGGVFDVKRKELKPTIAPGMNDAEELNEEATEQDIETGDYTSVTTLSWDEVDPSET